MAHHFRESWVAERKESHKNVQIIGYVRAFPYCTNEDDFKDGFNKVYVWLGRVCVKCHMCSRGSWQQLRILSGLGYLA